MAFQEFMIAPVGAKSINHAVRMGSEVYQELKQVVKEQYGSSGMFMIVRHVGNRRSLTERKPLELETKVALRLQYQSLMKHLICSTQQ